MLSPVSRCPAARQASPVLRTPADDHTAGGAWRLRRRRRCLDEAADDATKAVVWDERLALQLGTSARRGVVGAEPLSDGTSCAPKGVVGDACARLCGHTHRAPLCRYRLIDS